MCNCLEKQTHDTQTQTHGTDAWHATCHNDLETSTKISNTYLHFFHQCRLTLTQTDTPAQTHRQSDYFNPYPTEIPYGNGMVLHFYQQQESSTTKTVHKVINKGLKAYV
jgi:hypothetical protein